MKRHLLFVDDEPNVLNALRRTLRRKRHEWEMVFAPGGGEAIEIIGQQSFDAVISDMRMPTVDGAHVLDEAAKVIPSSIRLVLSGQADIDTTLRTIGPSHQFLAKPTDAEALIGLLEHLFWYQEQMGDPAGIGLCTQLPALPDPDGVDTNCERSDAIDSNATQPYCSAHSPSWAARLLQLTNSSYFDIQTRVYHPSNAADLIQPDILSTVIEQGRMVSPSGNCAGKHIKKIAAVSIQVARLCETIARAEGEDEMTCSCAYTTGLLHNVSQIASASLGQHNLPTDHMHRLSAYLMILWGLPEGIVKPIAHLGGLNSLDGMAEKLAAYLFAAESLCSIDWGSPPAGIQISDDKFAHWKHINDALANEIKVA